MTGAGCSVQKALAVVAASWMWVGCATPSASKAPEPRPAASPSPPVTLASPDYRPSPVVGPTNLGLCGKPKPEFKEAAELDARELAGLLNGTWWLNTRTIEGLTIPTSSRFYFDLDVAHGTPGSVRGTAMMLDAGNLGILDTRTLTRECPKDATLGAFWTVAVERAKDNPRRLTLTMEGEYLGSYGDFASGMKATEAMTFLKQDDAYLSGGLATPNGGFGEDVWDRVSLMGNVLTYLSCENGFIERYEKLSNENPRIDQLSLNQVWQHKKQTGELLDPAYGRRGR